MLITIELASLIVYISLEQARLSPEERATLLVPGVKTEAYSFFALSFVLFLCVYFLVSKLMKKRDQVTRNSQVNEDLFNQEIRALLATLILFSSTYILRGTWLLSAKPDSDTCVVIMIGLLVGIVCDFAPVIILQAYHYKNFN